MKLDITRPDVWAATIDDRPGGVEGKLAPLAKAGASFEFVIARRTPEKPGKGVVFVTPVKGAAQVKAAKAAGFKKAEGLHSVRVEGLDKPGLGARMAGTLADAGINLRGVSAAAIGRKCVAYLAVDTAADATKTVRALKAIH